MKKIILSFLLSTLFFNNGNAVSLYQALNETYKNNTQLNAERENINAAEEDINISKADYMPSLSLSGSKSFENTNELTTQSGTDASIDDVNPLSSSIKLEQKLFDQGRDFTHQKNIVGLELAKAKLVKKEQDILYSAIDAFTGLILAREKLNINRRNLNLLIRQVETDKVRLDRGQITITDLSQSESSLAGAQAQFTQSKSDLLISKLNYENIIGNIDDPSKLKKSSNSIVKIPENLSKAVSLSKENNPDIKIAELELIQSEKDIEISKSDLSPTASLSLERSYNYDFSTTYDEREKDVLTATVSWPFFSGGKNIANYKKNKSLETRKRLILDSAIKQNQTNVASAWSNYKSNKSLLISVQSQVKAAEIANEGITAEYNSGAGRSTLEVIQSNSLLLDAQISLADSERNFILSQFNLLKSMGLLSSDYLKI